VRVFNAAASVRFTLTPFPGFRGGVRVAAFDRDGDELTDIATAAVAHAGGGWPGRESPSSRPGVAFAVWPRPGVHPEAQPEGRNTPAPGRLPLRAGEAVRLRAEWAAHLGVEPTFVNSVGMPLAVVPPGEVELAPHSHFTLTRPFALRGYGVNRLLVDQFSPAGAVVAENTGLPYVALCNALACYINSSVPPASVGFRHRRDWLARARNRIAGELVLGLFDVMTGTQRGGVPAC
jgi:hypothetical protein